MRLGSLGTVNLISLEGQCRRRHVERRTQFVDVRLAVCRERDVGRDIERGRGRLGGQRPRGAAEVVIAIDQHTRRFLGDRFGQRLGGEIGERQAHRPAEVAQRFGLIYLPGSLASYSLYSGINPNLLVQRAPDTSGNKSRW